MAYWLIARSVQRAGIASWHVTAHFASQVRRIHQPAQDSQPLQKAPSIAPKIVIDTKSIRQNPGLYAQNALERNYKLQSTYPARINKLFEEWNVYQREARTFRERNNRVKLQLADRATSRDADSEEAHGLKEMSKEQLLEE